MVGHLRLVLNRVLGCLIKVGPVFANICFSFLELGSARVREGQTNRRVERRDKNGTSLLSRLRHRIWCFCKVGKTRTTKGALVKSRELEQPVARKYAARLSGSTLGNAKPFKEPRRTAKRSTETRALDRSNNLPFLARTIVSPKTDASQQLTLTCLQFFFIPCQINQAFTIRRI